MENVDAPTRPAGALDSAQAKGRDSVRAVENEEQVGYRFRGTASNSGLLAGPPLLVTSPSGFVDLVNVWRVTGIVERAA